MTDQKKYDLTNLTESYPGVYYFKNKSYILVKDNEHYLITHDRLLKLIAGTRGHHNEIVRDYKPRKRKPKDPNAPPRKKKQINKQESVIRGTPPWINPDYIDRKNDPYEYDEHGWRMGLQPWAKKHKDFKHLLNTNENT